MTQAPSLARAVLLAVCGAVTIGGFVMVQDRSQTRAAEAFITLTDNARTALIERVERHNNLLVGMQLYLDSSDNVTFAEWRDYVRSLESVRGLTSLVGLGYANNLQPGSLEQFFEATTSDGIADFRIRPARTGDIERYVIKFFEPVESLDLQGLDLAAYPALAEAARDAARSGETILAPPGPASTGGTILMLRPRYSLDAPVDTPEERLAALRGWNLGPLDPQVLVQEIEDEFAGAFRVRIDDAGARTRLADTTLPDVQPDFRLTEVVPVLGRNWAFTWESTPTFEAMNARSTPWIVLVAGVAVTALVAALAGVLARREIAVRRLVEERTRELEARAEMNRSFLDNRVVAMLIVDADGSVLSGNQAAARLFGYAVSDLKGVLLNNLIPGAIASIDWTLSTTQGVHRDGSTLYLDVQVNRWTNAGDNARSTVLIRDVSEQTRTSRQLDEQEERFNRAINEAGIGVFDIDLESDVSVVSNSWLRVMGLPADVTLENPQALFRERVHPEDRPIIEAANYAHIDGHTDRTVTEYRVRFDDGTWRWMRSNAVVTERDEDGRALRLLGVQTDVTDRHEAQDALRRSEERFRKFLAQAPVGMAIFDGQGRFLGLNEAMVKLTGYSEAELLEMRFGDLLSKDDLAQIFDTVVETHGDGARGYTGEHQLSHRNGGHVWALLSVAWTFDADRGSDLYIVQLQDISERREIERLKSEFVATVSHELRTPLTSVKGALDLVVGAMADKLPKSSLRLLDIAQSNTDRLIYLVNDILDLEKISAGQIDFHIQPESANELLDASVKQTRPIAVQQDVHLVWRPQEPDRMVLADAGRLNQVLLNLISNACKFSHAGGRVEVWFEVRGAEVMFFVKDEGVGISATHRNSIFKPFSQVDSSDTREKGGTGLGLNICKELVERMNGRIDFESTLGEGTTFRFTCPLAEPADAEPDETDAASSRTRILLVEGDAGFGGLLRSHLSGDSEVAIVTCIDAARERLRSARYDVVMVDLGLASAARRLVRDIAREHPDSKIVALNALAHDPGGLPLTEEALQIGRSLDQLRNSLRKAS
ncbi:PAS/PAC Sensor Hybrid Histidine Kinase [Oceanicola granulosus HTCC2516]|uniref:histidine kinase n=1 Tax=Oceanicola granulosus (strain ATCC BAA-861 / DSM 15982 / KCTC 12143 / HTCC2516) TaxID=314256 RepID=Q2CCB0_OCEGH|nr:PAS domain S-box protein [Oceanicola granulosus]EAR50323.1 PAS/PAC Sensor Hybrid Histidine Kinase [Oceanicola granulosus HTCC2516]